MTKIIRNTNDQRDPTCGVKLIVRNENILLMDNHRVALKIWSDFASQHKEINFVHIDAHDDCQVVSNEGVKKVASILHEDYSYLYWDKNKNDTLITWDNIVNLFIRIYVERLHGVYFWKYQDDDIGELGYLVREKTSSGCDINLLQPSYLLDICNILNEKHPIIVDIDIDYFFTEVVTGFGQKIMYSEEIIKLLFKIIKDSYVTNKNCLVTRALSPECCGGLDNSLQIFEIIKNVFGFNFSITNDNKFPKVNL